MAGLLRIRAKTPGESLEQSAAAGKPVDSYLSKLVKMIPGEAQSLYVVGGQVIGSAPENGIYRNIWQLVICGLIVVLVRWKGTKDDKGRPDFAHIACSLIAFYVWVYAASDALKDWPNAAVYKFLPTLLVLAATFAIPYFFPGNTDAQ